MHKDVNYGIVWDCKKQETKCPSAWLAVGHPCYGWYATITAYTTCLRRLSRCVVKEKQNTEKYIWLPLFNRLYVVMY